MVKNIVARAILVKDSDGKWEIFSKVENFHVIIGKAHIYELYQDRAGDFYFVDSNRGVVQEPDCVVLPSNWKRAEASDEIEGWEIEIWRKVHEAVAARPDSFGL